MSIASSGDTSPHSIVSHFEFRMPPREKAEPVLGRLVKILTIQAYYSKFTSILPMTRILLLLLGERPSSYIAVQVLTLIAISIKASSSFNRKFELVSGWSVLKTILPIAWDPLVNKAAFDLLLGRVDGNLPSSQAPTPTSASRKVEKEMKTSTTVSCTHIIPTILSALQTGLNTVAGHCHISEESDGMASLIYCLLSLYLCFS